MRLARLLPALGLLAVLPSALAGQQPGCDLIESGDWNVFNAGSPNEIVFMGGPVHFECDGGVTVKADSAIRMPERLQLIGRVFYGDTLKTLTAQQLDYFAREGRLFARGDVEFTDRSTRSVVLGQELNHERENEVRPESRTVVQGRPHAVFYPESRGRTEPTDTAAQPFDVDADWMEFVGERAFRASGNVELQRGRLQGSSNWAEFDNDSELLVLSGDARILDEAYELTGQRIEAQLDGDQLSELVATTTAKLTGEELTVDAFEIRIFTEDGALSRLVARMDADGRANAASSTNAEQVRATAEELLLLADSLDVLAPGQQLETLVAVGRAYAERSADSLAFDLPDIASHDWLRGDTITGHFTASQVRRVAADPAEDTGAPADSTRTETVLERLVAAGPNGTARSLYRIRERGAAPTDAPSITYTIADRIVLILRDGEVSYAEAVGEIQDIRGMHLQPGHRPDRGHRPMDSIDPAAARSPGNP